MIKLCKIHNSEKEYRERIVKNKIRREWVCKECESERGQQYYKNNKEDRINYQNNYYKDNKESVLEYKSNFYIDNKGEILDYKNDYYYNNKSIVQQQQYKYKKIRRNQDPTFKIREACSRMINFALNGNKNNLSILYYLPYKINELKEHLETQFEPWMTWDNWGVYNKNSWIENDQSTWTWQIDHIIPQADLLYTSMEDDNFKKCWALDNLRPLSAKQNILDGTSRVRHHK